MKSIQFAIARLILAILFFVLSSANAETILPHMTLESCFQCHVDARHLAVNPSGDITVHYGATNLSTGTAGGNLLCVDCHSTLTNLDAFNKHVSIDNLNSLPKIQCSDCHGTLTDAPLELINNRDEIHILRSDGSSFENVIKEKNKIILKSVTGQELDVSILKDQLLNNSWKSDLARQVKSIPKHSNQLQCNDCHSDWAPVCYGCHK